MDNTVLFDATVSANKRQKKWKIQWVPTFFNIFVLGVVISSSTLYKCLLFYCDIFCIVWQLLLYAIKNGPTDRLMDGRSTIILND